MITVQEIIKELEEIPPLPKAALDLLDLTNDIHANAGKATEILSKDPALSMKVLKAANSCKYGYSRHIGTVSQAVVILGFKGLRNLILGLAIYKFIGKSKNEFSNQLWKHLLITACFAKSITNKLGQEDPELGFLCGLIHDIGKAVLMNKEPEIYGELIERAHIEGISLHEIESDYLNFTHGDLGREICRSWNLPGILVRTVSLHHNKFFTQVEEECENELLQTVILADNLAKLYSVSDSHSVALVPSVIQLFEHRGVDQKFLEELFASVPEELSKLEDIFPGVFKIESEAKMKTAVSMSDPLQERILRLFILGKGFELVDDRKDAEMLISDGENSAETQNFILCDFFTNNTHFNDKLMFSNKLNKWLTAIQPSATS
ncbi:MAG: HDOD domain-containing protein [Lentisphaeraceae bacterium]|nr:HDOD domain-containing protein [Lentisphaeraceae bacterium]